VLVLCFLLFLCFRKDTQEIFLELDETKPEVPIFSRHETESKEESERGQEVATPPGGAGAHWVCHPVVCEPMVPSDIAAPPILSLRHENPKSIGVFPNKVPPGRCYRRPISGDRSLYSGTLPGWGIAPGAISIISIDFTAISIDVVVSHDEEGVLLPRGRGLYR
jgi:hypothetical protein